MPVPVAAAIELTDDERARLEAWARRRTSAQGLAQRSRIVLAAAEGLRNTEIAQRIGVTRPMVTKWRNRFAEHRLDGLTDEPRPGRPRTITDEQVEEVIVRTLETTPKDATHWSTRSMAAEVGLTQNAVCLDMSNRRPHAPLLSVTGSGSGTESDRAPADARCSSRLSHRSPSDPVRRTVMGRPMFKAPIHCNQMGRDRHQRRESSYVSHRSGS